MWILKFKSKEEWNIYNKRSLKFQVKILFYSRNYYVEGKKIYFVNSGVIFGEEKNKKQFFEDLKKDKKIEELEINKDFFISIYSEKETSERVKAAKTVYNRKIIFLKPAIFDEEGWEEWEIASFNRKDLEKILKIVENVGKENFKLISFKEEKATNIMMQSLAPGLSDQQEKALELAIQNKYYGSPRKITLKKLARIMKVSESTYQFHLAKAEEKIIPFFSNK